jgi:cobalt-zinc-cadmium efflux system membrane fusion protein
MNRSIAIISAILAFSLSCREKEQHSDGEHAHAKDEHKEGEHEEGEHEEGEHEEEGHKEGEHEGERHERVVRLSPEAVAAAGFSFAIAESKPLAGALTASARLTLTQDGIGRVSARVAGRVESIKVKLGEKVKKGQVLAVIESAELGQARADYLSARTKAGVAEATHTREKQLFEKGISAEKDLREAESTLAVANGDLDAADARLHAFGLSEAEIKALKSNEHYSSEFPIRAPIDGTVIDIEATRGLSVDGTTELFMVGELSSLWAIIDIFEQQLPEVHAGQVVELTVAAVPDGMFEGRVEYVADFVEEKSRTIEVRVAVPNPNARLKPGMFATARLRTERAIDGGAASNAVIVPREAVQKVGDETVVFIPIDAQSFQAVEVEVGDTTASHAIIRTGLEPGKRVVARGAFTLKSELSKESMGEGHSH